MLLLLKRYWEHRFQANIRQNPPLSPRRKQIHHMLLLGGAGWRFSKADRMACSVPDAWGVGIL